MGHPPSWGWSWWYLLTHPWKLLQLIWILIKHFFKLIFRRLPR